MSVPVHKRTEGKLKVLTATRALADYTLTICANEKNFPKRERWMLTDRIVTTALSILEEVDTANSIFVSTRGDYALRRKSQTLALAYTARLLGLMDLAHKRYRLSSERISYWTGLVIDSRNLIMKWRQSDKERYKNLK